LIDGIEKNFSLRDLNSFRVDVRAEQYALVDTRNALFEVLNDAGRDQLIVLGGGSNYLFVPETLRRLVVHVALRGREIIEQADEYFIVRAMAGEPWHDFVLWTLQQDMGGLENLSLIPGYVGAAPVQNIGAYGVEVKDTLVRLEAVNRQTGDTRVFSKDECAFGYRDSIFKRSQRDEWIILSVDFRLSRGRHRLYMDYGAIRQTLEQQQIKQPSVRDISNAVIRIRQQRLPDPEILPNAGSFFKNPVIATPAYEALKQAYPDTPGFALSSAETKIPAGWLIEQCGWKGRRQGACGVHEQHALVLVNYGDASGADIWQLAQQIQHSVKQHFAIQLVPEVNVVTQS
jgi:UDP-N-acetylmuramate dehydrogenase